MPTNRSVILFLVAVLLSCEGKAQSGGRYAFEFLNLQAPARTAALGGIAVATRADDISLVFQNPSQLQESMAHQLTFSYVKYPAGIGYGDIAYGFRAGKAGMFMAQIHTIGYGTFTRTDENGNELGTYSAGENALGVTWVKTLDSSLFIGATVKGVFSNLGDEKSNGIAADVGLTWYKKETGWCAAVVLRNAGAQLKTYSSGREALPFEIMAGVSKKLKNAPFRFSLNAQQLQRYDLTYLDPYVNTTDPLTGEVSGKKITEMDKIMRHMTASIEVLLTENFNLRFGYNILKRKELALQERKGMAGMSFGVGFRINRFGFSFAHETLNKAAGDNHFTLTTDFDSFKRKKKD